MCARACGFPQITPSYGCGNDGQSSNPRHDEGSVDTAERACDLEATSFAETASCAEGVFAVRELTITVPPNITAAPAQ